MIFGVAVVFPVFITFGVASNKNDVTLMLDGLKKKMTFNDPNQFLLAFCSFLFTYHSELLCMVYIMYVCLMFVAHICLSVCTPFFYCLYYGPRCLK